MLRQRLQTAEQAIEVWAGDRDRRIWGLGRLQGAQSDPERLAEEVAAIAADIAERPHLRAGPEPSAGPAVELRAAAEVRKALAEVGELGTLAPRAAELAELLGHVRVPLWRGPTEGRVRILSPYRLRATRVAELFVAGPRRRRIPRRGLRPIRCSPTVAAASSACPAAAIRPAEERYLFYSCVSRPERGLHLSYASTDEAGATMARSPFVDEVRALLDPPPDPDPARDELEAAADRADRDRRDRGRARDRPARPGPWRGRSRRCRRRPGLGAWRRSSCPPICARRPPRPSPAPASGSQRRPTPDR